MSVEENTKLDDQFIAAWDSHEVADAVALLSDDIVWRDDASPEPIKGKEAAGVYMQSWFTAFPDMKMAMHNHVVSDDQVAAEVEFNATNSGSMQMAPGMPTVPASGKRVHGRGTYFFRVRDGKIVEMHSHPDLAGMMMQMGMMQMPGG